MTFLTDTCTYTVTQLCDFMCALRTLNSALLYLPNKLLGIYSSASFITSDSLLVLDDHKWNVKGAVMNIIKIHS